MRANLCSECGEALYYGMKSGKPCPPKDLDGHYHERKPVYGEGTVPVCCSCIVKAGAVCGFDGERSKDAQPAAAN